MFSRSWVSLTPLSLPHRSLGNACSEPWQGFSSRFTLLAWSNTIILLSSCSPRLCQWQHLWVSDLAVLPKHPGEPVGPCWWVSDQSSAIAIKSCLLPHLSYPSAKGGIQFHFCVLSGKGGNIFQRTKNQRSHLIWGNRIWMWGVYAHVWDMGLTPSSNPPSLKCICVQDSVPGSDTGLCSHCTPPNLWIKAICTFWQPKNIITWK